MDEDARAANLKEALVLLKVSGIPEVAARAEAMVLEIEASMEAVGWARIPPPVEPLVKRLCQLVQSVIPPIPGPCSRFMCGQCHIDLLADPHTPAAQ